LCSLIGSCPLGLRVLRVLLYCEMRQEGTATGRDGFLLSQNISLSHTILLLCNVGIGQVSCPILLGGFDIAIAKSFKGSMPLKLLLHFSSFLVMQGIQLLLCYRKEDSGPAIMSYFFKAGFGMNFTEACFLRIGIYQHIQSFCHVSFPSL